MVKQVILFLSLFIFSVSYAQDLSVLINIPPNPTNHISDWASRKNAVTITFLNLRNTPAICKTTAILSLNGEIIARTKSDFSSLITIAPGSKMLSLASLFPPISYDLIGNKAKQISSSGILPDGNYELCIHTAEQSTSPAIGGPIEINVCTAVWIHESSAKISSGNPVKDSGAINGIATAANFSNGDSVIQLLPGDQGREPKWQIKGNMISISGVDANTGTSASAEFALPDSLFSSANFLSKTAMTLIGQQPQFPSACKTELAGRCSHGEAEVTWGKIISATNRTVSLTTLNGEPAGKTTEEQPGTMSVTMKHLWRYNCMTGKFTRQFIFQASGSKDGKEFHLNFSGEFETRDPDC